MFFRSSVSCQRRHVDHESVAHLAFQSSFISVIDFWHGHDFNVARHAGSAAEVQDLLNFVDAADLGARPTTLPSRKRKCSDRDVLLSKSHDDHGWVDLQSQHRQFPQSNAD